MEAYGQFAWKLRHYRAGPPASNHSSNGPVCRHLGGRLSKEDPLLLPFSLRPLIAALLFSFPLSLSLSPSFSLSLSLFLSLSYSPRRFHGATIPIPDVPSRVPGEGSSDYGQRVSTADQRGFIGGTGPGCSTPTNPFLDQQPIHSRSIDIFVHFETVLSFLLL